MSTMDVAREISLSEVLAGRALHSAYQPVVDLLTGQVVGYEALARGPVGTTMASPAALFGAAADEGLIGTLDQACREAAIDGARRLGLHEQLTLFVNVEPAALGVIPLHEDPLFAPDRHGRIVVEVTERMLCDRPAELLSFVRAMRERGCGIALDDVGAVDDSLALMPLVRPDVIKLDLSLVQQRPEQDHGRIMAAVLAHAERTGARILAEGIETADHIERALTLGATLGQGWWYGRPGHELDASAPDEPVGRIDAHAALARIGDTPFETVAAVRPTRLGRRSLLLALSKHLESIPFDSSQPHVVASAFQSADRFTRATAERYAALAERCGFVAALGVGLEREPAPGVRGGTIGEDDRLRDEWTVIVIGPHHAAALVAREVVRAPDALFAFTVTHDRPLVMAAAESLFARVIAG